MTDASFVERPDAAVYLAEVAALPGGQAYKSAALALLDLAPGLTVLDAGCGPGTDLGALRAAVGSGGRVIGVDVDQAMLSRAGELEVAELLLADVHALPLHSASVDRVKVDRVLQHVVDPTAALVELHRVCRPGAIAVVSEPDWGTLVVDSADPVASEAFARFTCEQVVRNATLGREVGRRAEQVGWTRGHVVAVTTTFDELETADRVLGLGRNSRGAVDAGYLTDDRRTAWLAGLAAGPVYAAATIVITRLTRATT